MQAKVAEAKREQSTTLLMVILSYWQVSTTIIVVLIDGIHDNFSLWKKHEAFAIAGKVELAYQRSLTCIIH